ncbi:MULTISPECIES: hypothetical protein [Streptomyces]|uniref:hypothetical protein n=1 Tax=Streptomyces TaxID=1883 RepID=UPI000BDA9F2E|nr:hypothetical protein [Streptomyces sp. Ag109_G2-15]SOD84837.1 hypothetical protein SAMN06272765_2231 [Streptomyces sp. Ag109_G2-15]
MDESRQSFPAGASAALRKMTPPPALCGFLLLLALMFAVSYTVGSAAGPVAPGMHGTGTPGQGGGSGDTGDAGDMDMHGGGDH